MHTSVFFFKSSSIAGLNLSYGIPRGYIRWTNFGITPLIAIIWCKDTYWLVFLDLVHVKPLSRLWDIANGGGRDLSFTTFYMGWSLFLTYIIEDLQCFIVKYIWLLLDSHRWSSQSKFHLNSFRRVQSF